MYKEHEKWQDIELGKHGVIIKAKGQSGVFLPEVPIEQQWTKEKLMENLCLKAGLPNKYYLKTDVHLSVFTSQYFEEIK